MKKIISIFVSALLVISITTIVYFAYLKPMNEYKHGQTLMTEKKYDKAITTFKSLGNYKNSNELANESQYNLALNYYKNANYKQSLLEFKKIIGYKNSNELANESQYNLALNYFKNTNYKQSLSEFKKISEYKNSNEMITECTYQMAISNDDIQTLGKLIDNPKYQKQIISTIYNRSVKLYKKEDFSSAKDGFLLISKHKDVKDYLKNIDLILAFQGDWVTEAGDGLRFNGLSVQWFRKDKNDFITTNLCTIIKGTDTLNDYTVERSDEFNVDKATYSLEGITSLIETLRLSEDVYDVKKGETVKNIYTRGDIAIKAPKAVPSIGMTADEVRNSTWGNPDNINRTTTLSGETEQWVYAYGYIYFDNGVVTSIQD